MKTEIALNGSTAAAARYVGWAPVPATVRLSDRRGARGPVNVTVRNRDTARGGQVVFFAALPGPSQGELSLSLPATGRAVAFHIAGQFQRASTEDGDAAVDVIESATGNVLGTTPLMVRVRKDAVALTAPERDRFLAAFARFNDRGRGRFRDFRNVHTEAGDPEAHANAGFLPWHRAFLLDLERELQKIDPSVALAYWRFDRPAPALFTREFMGVTPAGSGPSVVQFSPTNPLQFWVTDGVPGIDRRPLFRTQTEPARHPRFGSVSTEAQTVALGGNGDLYSLFRRMEGNPHALAHVSFTGSISDIPTAARDPLFFMLHANVDRLWAKWQWAKRRFDPSAAATFSPPDGTSTNPGEPRIGHRLDDTMWPWNGVTTDPRPNTAPGGTMATSPMTKAPGPRPTVRSTIDYQGVRDRANRLAFDYDDVPFEP